MKKRLKIWKEHSPSQALVVVLLAVTLLSIVIVSFLLTAGLHRSVSRQDYQVQAARVMAVTGLNSAITQIRTALGPWDDPYNNFCGGNAASAPPTFFWSVSPGIISRWSYTSTTPQNYPLFSQSAYGETNLANLNVPNSDGIYPIIGGASPPAIQVYWANVLQNPSLAPASTNRIIGRYAFWVDDESAKINLNTADGTLKYQTNSLGLGTPSEVSLQALQQGGANLSTTLATNIVYVARTTGFNSVPDILRATGTTPDLWTNNVFNLTTCSRSPDLNIFGQPKMAMMPILGDAALTGANYHQGTNMVLNGITLQPPREIYPTPSQLPLYTIYNPATSSTQQVPWPLTFRQLFGPVNSGNMVSFSVGWVDGGTLTEPNAYYVNGAMLAHYLAGTNAAAQAISWPPFSGSSSTGFAGKYTPRQIDSLVAQISSLGAKAISPDYFYSGDSTGMGYYFMNARGEHALNTPLILPGWLSGQWVSGVGRTAKVDSLLMEYDTWGSQGQTNNISTYTPPRINLDIWLEWWLPAAYLGGKNVIPINIGAINPSYVGGGYDYGLNAADRPSTPEWWHLLNPPLPTTSLPPPPFYPWPPSSIPKSDFTSSSYWANQLLTDNQGIDFAGNPNGTGDPDQGLAAQFHDPYALSTNYSWSASWTPPRYIAADGAASPGYQGTDNTFVTPFNLGDLQAYAPPNDWQQGEMRCLRSVYGSIIPLPMQTTADGSTLTVSGGIAVRSSCWGGFTAELDPVPLDTVRGNTFGPGGDNTGAMPSYFDQELWTSPANIAGLPSGSTVRDLAIASVIPTSFSMPIPKNGDLLDNTTYVLAQVSDPLVNKFPGDWKVTSSTSPPATTMEYSSATTYSYSSYDEYSSQFHNSLLDPDSYWFPQADCGISYVADLPRQTLIPRSARMPNIGYLQYMRTGIIPDDETQSYQTQHGTPFRLLSYAPSTDTANQKTTRPATNPLGISQPYPDWALLDLLYVPSILAPYGGPYGYYDPNNNNQWTGYGNPSVLSNYSTYGGSTPGRINPNGAVLYTTNAMTPLPGVSRTLPMQAVLQGLMVNQSLTPISLATVTPNPGWTGGTAVDAPTIAQAIYTYLMNKGPLRMPAELCNVPEIAALRPGVNATRNDLVRQVVGALTTQSNVFSVWTIGQTVMKNPANNVNYGIFESGDTVLAETRLHFVVERYLDPGADGVYGNTSNAGADGVVGTYDDPVDPVNHPYCPHYLYRVIAAEEVR